MPSRKRRAISFPELEHRGRNAILRSPEEVQAEEALLATATDDAPATTRPVPTDSPASDERMHVSVRARTRVPKTTQTTTLAGRLRQKLRARQHLSSYTFRFRPEELEQLDQIVAELNQSRTSKLSKNDLARLAVSWLLADYAERGQSSLVVEVTSQE